MTENNTTIKKVRKTKPEKFQQERENVLLKLNKIIGIDEENNKFNLEQLKKNTEIHNQIKELEEEVKRYFVYNRWTYFNRELENDWLCLMKNIYKDMGYELAYRQRCKDGEKYKEYSINKKI